MNNVSWSSLVWPHVVSFHIDIETTLILRDKQGRETGSLVVLPLGLDSGDGIVNSLKHVVHKTNSWRIQLTREPRHKTYEPALDTIFALRKSRVKKAEVSRVDDQKLAHPSL
jgi:hypothetical protein